MRRKLVHWVFMVVSLHLWVVPVRFSVAGFVRGRSGVVNVVFFAAFKNTTKMIML